MSLNVLNTNKRICFLNISANEMIHSLFYNKSIQMTHFWIRWCEIYGWAFIQVSNMAGYCVIFYTFIYYTFTFYPLCQHFAIVYWIISYTFIHSTYITNLCNWYWVQLIKFFMWMLRNKPLYLEGANYYIPWNLLSSLTSISTAILAIFNLW